MTLPASQPPLCKTHMSVSGKQKTASLHKVLKVNQLWITPAKRRRQRERKVQRSFIYTYPNSFSLWSRHSMIWAIAEQFERARKWDNRCTTTIVKAVQFPATGESIFKSGLGGCSKPWKQSCVFLLAQVSLTVTSLTVSLPWNRWKCRAVKSFWKLPNPNSQFQDV